MAVELLFVGVLIALVTALTMPSVKRIGLARVGVHFVWTALSPIASGAPIR
jgi:hypothetical protein